MCCDSVMATVQPVFLLCLPPISNSNDRYEILENLICLAAERMRGSETIVGAQDIGGMWRVYPLSRQARNQLLSEGVCLRGHKVQAYDQNPFILSGQNDVAIPSTKLWLSDIPLSCANVDTESALSRLGVALRSKLIQENPRNRDGKLTRFWTGRLHDHHLVRPACVRVTTDGLRYVYGRRFRFFWSKATLLKCEGA